MNSSQWRADGSFVSPLLLFCTDSSVFSSGPVHIQLCFFITTSSLSFSSLHLLLLLLSFSPHWIPLPAVPLSLCPGLADRDPRVRPAGCGRHAAGQQGKTSLPARRATGRQMDSWRKREGGMMERVLSRSGGREGD